MKIVDKCKCGIARVDCEYHRDQDPYEFKVKKGIVHYDASQVKVYVNDKLLEERYGDGTFFDIPPNATVTRLADTVWDYDPFEGYDEGFPDWDDYQ